MYQQASLTGRGTQVQCHKTSYRYTHTVLSLGTNETHFLELLNLGLVKHGEDVGGGPLAAPLGVLLPCCLSTTLGGEDNHDP